MKSKDWSFVGCWKSNANLPSHQLNNCHVNSVVFWWLGYPYPKQCRKSQKKLPYKVNQNIKVVHKQFNICKTVECCVLVIYLRLYLGRGGLHLEGETGKSFESEEATHLK